MQKPPKTPSTPLTKPTTKPTTNLCLSYSPSSERDIIGERERRHWLALTAACLSPDAERQI
jgi:hypothetical protein